MEGSIKEKGIKAFVWDFLGRFFNQSSSFIVTILIARVLTPEDFGVVAIALMFNGIASVLADSGFGGALIRNKNSTSLDYDTVFAFNFFISIFLFLILNTFSHYIASYFQKEELTALIQVTSFSILISSLCFIHNIKLKKDLRFDALAKVTLISTTLSGLIGVIACYNGLGVWSLVLVTLLNGFFRAVFMWKSVSWLPKSIGSTHSFLTMWKFSSNMLLTSVLEIMTINLEKAVLAKAASISTLGYFQRAQQFSSMVVNYTSGPIYSVLFSLLSGLGDDFERYKKKLLVILDTFMFVVLMVSGVGYSFSEALIVGLLSEKWLPSVTYLELLFLGAFSVPMISIVSALITSQGHSKEFLYITVLNKAFIVISLLLVKPFGVVTYLTVLIFGNFLSVNYALYILKKVFNLKLLDLSVKQFKLFIAFFISIYMCCFSPVIGEGSYFVNSVLKSVVFLFSYLLLYKVLFVNQSKEVFLQLNELIRKVIK